MRLFKSTYRDRSGKTRETAKWYVEFRDQHEITRRVSAFSNKRATEELGKNIEQLVSYHLATGGQIDPALQCWITDLPKRTRDKLVSIGLIRGERVAVTRPLREHLHDYEKALQSKGNTEKHVAHSLARIQRVFDGCGFVYLGDISASKVQNFLRGLRDGEEGMSIQTSNYYLGALKAFCRWMVKDGRAPTSPLDHLSKLSAETDEKRKRRALSADELRLLIATASGNGTKSELPGKRRALLYRLAVETGLRAGELRSLTKQSFALDASPPSVTVAASYSKRRRTDVLPLRADTAELLAPVLKRLGNSSPLFPWSNPTHIADMVRSDLAAARAAWLEQAGSPAERKVREKSDFLKDVDARGRVVDFHALRHTFITNLASGGVHPKTAQILARHSTITLTMDRYTHSEKGAQLDALAALPDLSVSADCLARNGTSEEIAGDPERLDDEREECAENPRNAGRNAVSRNGPGGIRTLTGVSSKRILSPPRLPFRHGPGASSVYPDRSHGPASLEISNQYPNDTSRSSPAPA